MRLLYIINKIALILNLLLYLTFFYGLYAQIILGTLQILTAIIVFFFWKKIPKKSKERIYIYWGLVTIYSLFWVFDMNNFNNIYSLLIGMILIPMSIAIYFVITLRFTKNTIS